MEINNLRNELALTVLEEVGLFLGSDSELEVIDEEKFKKALIEKIKEA